MSLTHVEARRWDAGHRSAKAPQVAPQGLRSGPPRALPSATGGMGPAEQPLSLRLTFAAAVRVTTTAALKPADVGRQPTTAVLRLS